MEGGNTRNAGRLHGCNRLMMSGTNHLAISSEFRYNVACVYMLSRHAGEGRYPVNNVPLEADFILLDSE